jgi:hypothetical protein
MKFKCEKCQDVGMVIFEKEAPSPPYKKGSTLTHGVPCTCTIRRNKDV